MSGNFAPGDLVVYVDDKGMEGGVGDETFPVLGSYYRVREATLHPRFLEPAILLEEIINPPHRYKTATGVDVYEAPWRSRRFRPVDPRRLEVFRKALTGRPVTEDA